METVCVIGLGYIGLPTALMLATHGIHVVGVDSNPIIVEKLDKGQITFKEEGLDELLHSARSIKFVTVPVPADVYIIAVPTPFDKFTKRIDVGYVSNAVRDVLEICPKSATLIVESTVSPGAIDKYIRPIVDNSGKEICLAHAPERIIPGNMVYELKHNSRIIGADSQVVAESVKLIYSSFCRGEIVLTDIRSAEMAKIVENTFRDINIALANELAKICRQGNMNVYEIIRIANMHPRVNILQPGPGVGGHCISVDPWFLVGDYPQLSLLIHEARKINDSMPMYVLERIYEIMCETNMQAPSRIGFYGVTYKEDVDDIRESPTLQLFELIKRNLGQLPKVYDPMLCEKTFSSQYLDFDEFINDIDFIVIMVGHSHLNQYIDKLKDKIVLDTRNVYYGEGVYKL